METLFFIIIGATIGLIFGLDYGTKKHINYVENETGIVYEFYSYGFTYKNNCSLIILKSTKDGGKYCLPISELANNFVKK